MIHKKLTHTLQYSCEKLNIFNFCVPELALQFCEARRDMVHLPVQHLNLQTSVREQVSFTFYKIFSDLDQMEFDPFHLVDKIKGLIFNL